MPSPRACVCVCVWWFAEAEMIIMEMSVKCVLCFNFIIAGISYNVCFRLNFKVHWRVHHYVGILHTHIHTHLILDIHHLECDFYVNCWFHIQFAWKRYMSRVQNTHKKRLKQRRKKRFFLFASYVNSVPQKQITYAIKCLISFCTRKLQFEKVVEKRQLYSHRKLKKKRYMMDDKIEREELDERKSKVKNEWILDSKY